MDFFMDKNLKKYGYYVGVILGVYLSMKYLVPLVWPFLIAILLIFPLRRFLRLMHQKYHINKAVLMGGMILLLLLLFFSVFGGVFAAGTAGIREWTKNMDTIWMQCQKAIHSCCYQMESVLGIDGMRLEQNIITQVNMISENLQTELAPKMVSNSLLLVKKFAAGCAFAAITIIATLLLANEYEELVEKVRKLAGFEHIRQTVFHIEKLAVVFIKAQLIIMFCISLIVSLCFLINGNKYWFIMGIITGMLDALPFIGTGIVLISSSFLYFLGGQYSRGIICIVTYIVCVLIREFLEPKLIGRKIGVSSVGVLMALYVGIKLYGIAGLILGPLSLLIIVKLISFA